MAEAGLLCVPPGLVLQLRPLAGPFIERGCARHGRLTAADIWAGLQAGELLLWLAVESDDIGGVIVTALLQDGAERVCRIMTTAGRLSVLLPQQKAIEAYARAERCTRLRAFGRPGWQRILRDCDVTGSWPQWSYEKAL